MTETGKLFFKLSALGALFFASVLCGLQPAFADNGKLNSSSVFQQDDSKKTITGKIRDAEGSMVGVAVYVEGTTEGTITDIDGNFQMDVTPGTTLKISYVGYEDKTITVGDENFYDIMLEPSSEFLDEIVVIGYGTAQRKNLVGAVDQVQSRAVEGRPVANLTQALQGTSPSLIIQQRSMNPNDNSMNINIRGISTINNNDPLLVIDGMVSNNIGDMNDLNPNDIESISVLKDAGTSAIYGSRAGNGVILVTTKKGSFNMKPEVSFSVATGIQEPDILLTPVKGYQNALLRNDSYVNAGANPIYSPQEIAQYAQGDSEWGLEAVMQNALQQSYNLGIRGGTESTSYNVSFGYYDQESNFKGPDYGISRYNFRTNLVSQFGKFKFTTVLGYNRNENLSDRGGLWISDVMRVPTYNTYDIYPDEEGKYYNNEIVTGGNFLASLNHGGTTENDNDHFQGIVTGEFDIWKGLKAKAVLGYDLKAEHRLIKRRYYPVYDYKDRDLIVNEASSDEFHIEDFNAKSTMMNTQLLLEYDRTFNEIHKVNGVFGHTSESYRYQSNEIKRHYVDPDLYQDTDDTIYETSSYNTPNGFSERALYSWIGRVGYSYMDRYYLELSGRYDGSSKFTENNRWGFFPSASLGWRISDENFFSFWKDRFGDLKLRGSYGILGSQSVGDYEFMTTYNIYTNQYGFNNSAVTGTGYEFGNELLTWEKMETYNIGVDATFLNNRLSVAYDYFYKYTRDMLLAPITPGTLGGAFPDVNRGEMSNLGWEVSVNYRLYHGEFSHFFGLNLGDSFNKLVSYGNQEIFYSDEIQRLRREGVPLHSYYGYKSDGFFQNYEEIENSALPVGSMVHPGDAKYVDRNGDGVINDNDRYILGNGFPRYTFGFTYNMNWKGFDVDMLWQGVGKRDMALRGEMVEPFHGSYYYVMFEHQLDYWSPGNTDARYPRLVNSSSPSYSNNYSYSSDRNIYDAAYLRLKNIQVGYTIPERITSRVGIDNLRIYLSGQNLLTFAKNDFIDPESSEFGNNMNAGGANSGRNYPTLKYYGGGIEVKF
jgi:TonB-linked SusC/RagA family outer membrane protein